MEMKHLIPDDKQNKRIKNFLEKYRISQSVLANMIGVPESTFKAKLILRNGKFFSSNEEEMLISVLDVMLSELKDVLVKDYNFIYDSIPGESADECRARVLYERKCQTVFELSKLEQPIEL